MGKDGLLSPEAEGAGHCQAQSNSSPSPVHWSACASGVLGWAFLLIVSSQTLCLSMVACTAWEYMENIHVQKESAVFLLRPSFRKFSGPLQHYGSLQYSVKKCFLCKHALRILFVLLLWCCCIVLIWRLFFFWKDKVIVVQHVFLQHFAPHSVKWS